MAKITLGQSKPAAATLTTLYTVPALKEAVVSTILVCNHSSVTDSFRISIQIAAAADADKQYIARDTQIAGNDIIEITTGITMATTDVLKVYTTNGTLSFSAFGDESTA